MKYCLISTLLFTSTLLAADITFLTHNLQSQTYVDEKNEFRGKEHGGYRAFHLELVRAMKSIAGQNKAIEEVPFSRGLKMVQTLPDYALFNVSKTEDRAATLKWVGPLFNETDHFYKLTQNELTIASLNDAKKVDGICVLKDGMHQEVLQQYGFDNLVINVSYEGCFKMLKAGRVALAPSGDISITKKLQLAGMTADEVVQIPVKISEVGGYIAFSNNIPDAIIAQLQAVLDELKHFGQYQQLAEHYY